MNPRHQNRTYRSAASAAHSKVMAARQALTADLETAAEDEPMRRYPHPIVQCECGANCSLLTGDASAAMTQILEQLSCQNQLLMDILTSLNSLTATILAQGHK